MSASSTTTSASGTDQFAIGRTVDDAAAGALNSTGRAPTTRQSPAAMLRPVWRGPGCRRSHLSSPRGFRISQPARIASRDAQTVLVTGGAGYIGVPLVEELLRDGRRVRVLDVLM